MTEPDTESLRSRSAVVTPAGNRAVMVTTAERDALCDGYDEAQRLRAAWATERDGAEGLAADLHAARQALTDLIGELRGLEPPVLGMTLRAVIDRHDPEATP